MKSANFFHLYSEHFTQSHFTDLEIPKALNLTAWDLFMPVTILLLTGWSERVGEMCLRDPVLMEHLTISSE